MRAVLTSSGTVEELGMRTIAQVNQAHGMSQAYNAAEPETFHAWLLEVGND